jgi:hypothetical protein
MATNLRVNFIGQNQLSKTTAVASRDLKKLGATAKNVGNSINRSLGAVGLGIGLAALTQGLKNATKAASEDVKSQGLLATALKNTVGATSEAIAGAEKYIKSTQLQTSVLDDELRPALATAVRATGSLAKGQEVLDVALDVSAGTGKDLSTVTNAMAKAFNGNTASLRKLLPSIKTGSDFMEQLKVQFAGSAETAANLDPYKRLEVIFADIQETVGMALLPALEEFSAYLASPVGQKNVQELVDAFVSLGKAVGDVGSFLIKNITLVKGMIAVVLSLKLGFIAFNSVVRLGELGVLKVVTALKLARIALITTGLGALAVALGTVAAAFVEAGEESENAVGKIKASDLNGMTYWEFQAKKAQDAWSKAYEAKASFKIKGSIKAVAKAVGTGLKKGATDISKNAKSFRDSIGLAFGTFGEDEYSVFNVDVLIAKMKRVVAASKGFAQNLAKLRKQGADQSLIGELTAMGPAQGNIVAQGLLSSGKLGEILKLRGSLYNTGIQTEGQQAMAGNATYEININKATISASDIIREIKLLEKKSGRKYLVN